MCGLVKISLDSELEKSGIAVNTDICVYFPHTRRDLYNIVMVEEIETFDELIEKHGSGRGCEVCRQAVGSILASDRNEHTGKSRFECTIHVR